MRGILLAQSLLVFAALAFGQVCVPTFYNCEPRDSEWYYGTGKGSDAQAARTDALSHLFVKVSGGQADIPMGVLAGWEQDDHGECRGAHYALVRIEKERAKRNMADALRRRGSQAKPEEVPKSVVVNNINITQTPDHQAAPEKDRDLKYFILLVIFLCFIIGSIALLSSPKAGTPAPAPMKGSIDVRPEPKPRPQAPRVCELSESFQAVARQPQAEAMSEIARTGIPAYLRAHKGEGTCKSISGSEDLVKKGVGEMAKRYEAQGWKLTAEKWAYFAVLAKEKIAMGFGFFFYASQRPGYTDCEVLFGIGAPVEDSYRVQMEEGLHQGLPWMVQAAAVQEGAAKSREEGSA